jgi:DNA repair photolyase
MSLAQNDKPLHGRGTGHNPTNRFERLAILPDADAQIPECENISPRTQFFRDSSKSAIAYNSSPDIGFSTSLNPYRGCEHGCIYCYARPTHEYLGFSAGLDFETRIMVKEDAPELLRKEMSKKSWVPQTVVIGGVTDPYQPVERKLKLTRRCLEVFLEFKNPATVITKNHLVTRDVDLLSAMAKENLTGVFVSITTLRPDLTRIMEPRTAVPKMRLAVIEKLAKAGVPVGVMVAPVIPGLTDEEMPAILKAAADAGAITAGYVPVRLPFAVKELFEKWLEEHMPDRKDKVLNRIRSIRDGKLNDSNFHTRMRGHGVFAEQLKNMFDVASRKAGIPFRHLELSTAAFRPPGAQMGLF